MLVATLLLAAQGSTPTGSPHQMVQEGEGYCSQFKEFAKDLGEQTCWYTAQADNDCVHPAYISYGKAGGSRAGRCLCDRTAACAMIGDGHGVNGFHRLRPADVVGHTGYPTLAGMINGMVQESTGGYCNSFFELTPGMTEMACWQAVQSESSCVFKDIISYGQGTRAGRCLCDTVTGCTLTGATLGANGFLRLRPPTTSSPSAAPVTENPTSAPTDAPTFSPSNVGATFSPTAQPVTTPPTNNPTDTPTTNVLATVGYCANHKELHGAKDLGNRLCWEIAQLDSACVHPAEVSYGKPGGSREGRCLCDTVPACPLTGLGLGADGFDRIRPPSETHYPTASTDSPTYDLISPGMIEVGEGGYCANHFELIATHVNERACWDAAQAHSSCVNKEVVSWGLGHRDGRCLCDTVTNCVMTGINLGENGFLRITLTEAPTNAPTQPTVGPTQQVTTLNPTTAAIHAALQGVVGKVIVDGSTPHLITSAISSGTGATERYDIGVSTQTCSELSAPSFVTLFKTFVATNILGDASTENIARVIIVSDTCTDKRRAGALAGTGTIQVQITATESPTDAPSSSPTATPTDGPTSTPTESPTHAPTGAPERGSMPAPCNTNTLLNEFSDCHTACGVHTHGEAIGSSCATNFCGSDGICCRRGSAAGVCDGAVGCDGWHCCVCTTSSTHSPTGAPAVAIRGDPFTTFQGKKTQFYLTPAVVTALLHCGNVEVFGRAVNSVVKNDDQQWFDMFQVNVAGEKIVTVEAHRTQTNGSAEASEAQDAVVLAEALQRLRLITQSKNDAAATRQLTTLNVHISGKAANTTGVHNVGKAFVTISQDMSKHIGNGFVESVQLSTKELGLSIQSSVAGKFANDEDRVRNMHVDIAFNNIDATKCSGALPEIWGVKPLSKATAKLLLPPNSQ